MKRREAPSRDESSRRPTLRQLEYLVAVAETLNFREAARFVHVTQPALSAQIQQLEEQLGVALFERDRRRVLITPAGSTAANNARRVLAGVDELTRQARGFKAPLEATLKLGVIPTIAPYLLPRTLQTVRESYPELRLVLREEQTHVLLGLLTTGRLDAALLALPHGRTDLIDRSILDDPFFLAAPAGHPLADLSVVDEAHLQGESVLLLEDGHCLRDQALAICHSLGAHELLDFRASSLTTLLQMVRGGLGVTLIPEMAIESESRAGGNLAIVPFRDPAPTRTIALCWRKTSTAGAELELLAELLR